MNQSTIVGTVIRGLRLSVAAALLASLLTITQPARAATYEVTNSNNSGPGSLRQAIDDANNNPGADTITFTAATDGNPIVLAGAANENGNASGDLDILGGGDLTIQGNGAANTLIDGGGIDRVFDVCPGGCINTVTFLGVTIRNGNADDLGGGIFNYGTTTVNGSIVSANTAHNSGGGIFNRGMLTVDGSTVSANTSLYGGGVFNLGTLEVQNGSTIGGVGAGNKAADIGGGIYNDGTTTVTGSTVSANTTDGSGGGIFNYGTTTVTGSTIGGAGAGNTADLGGGIYNHVDSTTTVDASTISDNTAGEFGGGIYNYEGTTTVDGSTVSDNTAGEFGGGIYNYEGTTTVNGSTVSDNTADESGGGFYNLNGTATVDGSTISGNTATSDGGGICNIHTPYAQNGDTTTVTGSRFLNNTAANNGGAVYNKSNIAGVTSVTGNCIAGNSAMSYFNSQPALQIATGNWWGASTGPNTPGADTVSGNVDVSDHLTAPIIGCAPDLQVDKTNDTGGNGTVGIPFDWTLTVRNTGIFSATFVDSQTILKDDLPAGPTYGAPLAGSFLDVANSANIHCSLAGNTLACAAGGGDVTLEPLTGSFEVTFSVTPSTPETLVNPAGICQVDPDGHVTEDDESNNDCPENVVKVWTNHLYLPFVSRWY